MILYGTHGWIHLSIGRADRWFRWGVVEWAVTILLFLACLHWGPEGIAVAWCVSFWILTIPAMWYAGRPIGLGVAPMLAVVWRYIAASLLAGLVSSLICSRFASLSAASSSFAAGLRVAVVSICFGCIYLGAVVLLHGGFSPLRKSADLLRQMILPGFAERRFATSAVKKEIEA
jgi:PST family polysaccharide transporter